jgi:tRNA pseudouridine55 synthase
MGSTKTYIARVHFGIETDTYDAEGRVIAENPAPISRETVEAGLESFRGPIEQIPPMYSAIQQGGRRLYDLARAGEEVEREPRSVTIEQLELLVWNPPLAELRVICSPGPYIRSLAFDLGRAIGVGAHLAALERSASGPFTVENAVRWPDLQVAMETGTWRDYLLPPDLALNGAPAVLLSETETRRLRQGLMVPAVIEAGGLARGYDPGGLFFAVLEGQGDQWKPHKVLF